MKKQSDQLRIIRKLMFKLLPIQVMLAVVGAVNGIVSSYFASNFIGVEAMSVVGLYSPISMLTGAISTMILGGSAILCGKLLGKNDRVKLQQVFSLDLAIAALSGIIATLLFAFMALADLTGFFTADPAIRPLFNRYLLGQSIGFLPFFVGNQLPPFLTMENKGKNTIRASIVYIVVNLILNIVFVKMLGMKEFGLALSSSIGLWIFLLVLTAHFFSGKSSLKITFGSIPWKEWISIVTVGFPGAASYIYQTFRGLIVNKLLEVYTGADGISAFAASNSFLALFWAIPTGMLAVSRLLISVSVGEEDRQTLGNIMRVMFRSFLPLMFAVDLSIIALARPFSFLFFKDAASAVFRMCESGFRIIPWCMPLSVIYMHFNCYGQVSGKHFFVNLQSLLDGVICVAGFSFLLIPFMSINGVYAANILNGIVTTLVILIYAIIRNGHFPKNLEELMVIPKEFGVAESERIDLNITTIDEVVEVSRNVQSFCLEKGIDRKRSYLAGLAMEEMAGNIVEHGFSKDEKKHSIDIRVAHKNNDIILRIRDDCVPFNPKERNRLEQGDEPSKNIGIRMIYAIMNDIDYQYTLGLNVLTIRI